MGSMMMPIGSCSAICRTFRSISSPTATTFCPGVTDTEKVNTCSPFSLTISKGASSELRVILVTSPNRIISVDPGVPIFISFSSSTLLMEKGCAIRRRRPSKRADPAPTTWFSRWIFAAISSIERPSLVSLSSSISI